MSTALTSIFGDEIIVSDQPRQFEKQFVAFPGATGVIGMDLGSRGRQIVISGRLRHSGASYAAARAALRADIAEIEEYYSREAADYTYFYDTYKNLVFVGRLQIVPDDKGKLYHWDGSQCFCSFIAQAYELI